jgi:hypothetical protein
MAPFSPLSTYSLFFCVGLKKGGHNFFSSAEKKEENAQN